MNVHHRGNLTAEYLSFATRLNRLIDAVYPPGRGPYRNKEIVHAAAEYGHPVSAAYISQLRSGCRCNPSTETLAMLAEFFRVKIEYFTDDVYYASLDDELTSLAQPRDDAVAGIAVGLSGLSAAARREFSETVDRVREK